MTAGLLLRRCLLLSLAALAFLLTASLMAGAARAASFEEFGFESASAEETTSQAGMHPDLTIDFTLNHVEEEGLQISHGRLEDLTVQLPAGLSGNPNEVPRCSTGEFLAANCPIASQVGVVEVLLSGSTEALTEPLYNLAPPHPDQVARLGFFAATFPTYIDISVRTASDYGLTATIAGASAQAPFVSAKTTLWGNPADPSHNTQRLLVIEALFGCHTACSAPNEERSSGLSSAVFLSNPTACEEQTVKLAATSYELPGQVFPAEAALPPITGCAGLPFDPSLTLATTNHQAGAPTGLDTVLRIPQSIAVNLPASSAMRAAKVVLPAGMTISPSSAEGLDACSDQQVGLGQETDSHCPDAAKLGSATLVSPALPEPVHGSIYQRTPEPGHPFRLWLVSDEWGLHLKLPGEVHADPQSGQLTTVFEETPQLPVEEITLSFKGGPRAPLSNPDTCGSHPASYELTPWSGDPPVAGQATIQVDQGCATGGFSPKLAAGVTRPVARSFAPLVMSLLRQDGEENVASFDVTLPRGELAKLAGVPLCPEAGAATAACPAASRIGSLRVATGSGPQPLWLPQPGREPTALYLAGPYKGAPDSIVTKVPVQAGPFDFGTVVVRAGIYINPVTAQVTVKTDRLPQIIEGVPIRYRTIHTAVDRQRFTLNPTSCAATRVSADVLSALGKSAHPADRFQVGNCAALRFAPRLKLRLTGPTNRGAHPALTAVLRTRKGEANLRKISVALPHSEFLAQEHIDTVCTRVAFAADNCPAGSVYGFARAFTPLLQEPLEGPVYLRSSSHPLPDLVAALRGEFDIDLAGRIDSPNGGLRATFWSVPDAPVSKFVLKMSGGAKGLLVNSENICRAPQRALVRMDGQNGRVHDFRAPLRRNCR